MNRLYYRICVVSFFACAPAAHSHVPASLPLDYTLVGWPMNHVEVVASDARPGERRSDDASALLKRTVERALAPPGEAVSERNWVRVTLNELVVAREGARWKASAEVAIEVTDTWGKSLRKTRGKAHFGQTAKAGSESANACLDEALRQAVLQALTQLGEWPL